MKLVTMKSSLRYDGSVCVEVMDGNTTYSLIWNYRMNSKKVKAEKRKKVETASEQSATEEITSSDE